MGALLGSNWKVGTYQHCYSHKSKTLHYRSSCEETYHGPKQYMCTLVKWSYRNQSDTELGRNQEMG